MDDKETKAEEKEFQSAKELLKHNQAEIVRQKEAFYDKIISSLHLTKTGLDILILVLLAVIVIIFLTAGKNGSIAL